MTSKLNINWLNKCRCGNRMHTVETVRGSHVRLFEDDAVKCNSCGRKGVIQTCDGIATVLWETDEEHMTNNQLAENSITQLLNSVKLARDNAERDDNRVDHSFYYALTIALDELQERRKAEKDSEPVAWLAIYHGEVYDDAIGITRSVVEAQADHFGWESALTEIIPLYRHAQPALTPYAWSYDWACCVTCEGPQDFEPVIEREPPAQWAIDEGRVKNLITLYRTAQPAPVVPNEMLCEFYEVDSWPDLVRELVKHVEQLQDSAKRNVKPWEDTFPETLLPAYIERIKQADEACRAAMLQAGNSPVISGAEQRIADAVELLKQAAPAMLADNHGPDGPLVGRLKSPVVPDGSTDMLRRWMVFGLGMQSAGSQLPRNLISETEAILAAAPQSPGSEPATVPGKWIPVSERMPEDDDFVYIWPRPDFGVELHVGQYCECSPKGEGWYAQIYEQNYGVDWYPITVTHWMPLPAAPQEVNHG